MLKAKVITQGRVRRRKQNDVKINIIPIWLSDLAFLLASLCFRENLFSPSIVVFSDLHGPTSDKTLLVLDGFRPSPCLKLLVVMVLIFPMGTADLIFLCSLLNESYLFHKPLMRIMFVINMITNGIIESIADRVQENISKATPRWLSIMHGLSGGYDSMSRKKNGVGYATLNVIRIPMVVFAVRGVCHLDV